jgi:hypothetical protein
MWYLLNAAVGGTQYAIVAYLGFGLWIFFTKIVKLIPHFWRHPWDIRFIPLLIAFSYIHGFLNVYALCTMRNTVWGSQDLKQLEGLREEEVALETGENDHTNSDAAIPMASLVAAESDSAVSTTVVRADSPIEQKSEGQGGSRRRRGRASTH